MKFLTLIAISIILSACVDGSPSSGRPAIRNSDPDQQFLLSGGINIAKSLISQSHRDKDLPDSADLVSNYDESFLLTQSQGIPSYYRDTPMVAADDDNRNASIERPLVECGKTQATLALRVADCKTLNGFKATAQGKKFGNMGEGNWQLVTKTQNNNAGSEVWMDLRTRLVWSDRLEANNWCRASGNQENIGGIDCSSNNQDYCQEDTLFQEQKGNLETIISWRLPSRNDLLQADINGSKVVLLNNNFDFWSATTDSTNNAKAWTVHGKTGILASSSRSSVNQSIRCVGRILK